MIDEIVGIDLGTTNSEIALYREGRPEVLAKLIRRALAKRKSHLIYPRFYALAWSAPWFARWLKDRMVPPQALSAAT